MTKAELIESMKNWPDDFEVVLDAEGLTPIQSVMVDSAAGTIFLQGV